MPKLHSYGCSFSWPISIQDGKSFPTLVAERLNYVHIQNAFPALCNDEIFSRFCSSLSSIKKDDIILYQFTFPVRKGFVINNSDYESSAGFFADVNANPDKLKSNPFVNQEMIDYLFLNSNFIHYSIYFLIQRVVSILKFLEETLEIKYRLLFINDEYDDTIKAMNSIKKKLRVDKPDYDLTERFFISFADKVIMFNESISILDYVYNNKLTVSAQDTHPNQQGHNKIAEQIINTFTL